MVTPKGTINAEHVRRSDCFGRVGGEEFLLVLSNTSTAAAELIVERMLAAIRNSGPLWIDGTDFRCTDEPKN